MSPESPLGTLCWRAEETEESASHYLLIQGPSENEEINVEMFSFCAAARRFAEKEAWCRPEHRQKHEFSTFLIIS